MRSPGICLLLDGRLSSYELTVDGRRLLFEIITPGGLDGVMGTLGLTSHFTEAIEDSLIGWITPATLRNLVGVEPIIAANLIQVLSKRVARREDQLQAMVLRNPARRIAKQLLALADVVGEPAGQRIKFQPRLTHQAMADMLGLRRETVTLHLALLHDVGALRKEGTVFSASRAALEAIVEGRFQTQRAARRVAGRRRPAG